MADTDPGAEYSIRKERRGYSTLLAVDPHTGKEWDVLLPGLKMDWVKKQGQGAAKEMAFTLPWALRNIRHLHRGVRDDDLEIDDDKWLCYIAAPSRAYNWRTGSECNAWEDELFLVYVTDERVVYHWGWYACDGFDNTLPVDHKTRFKDCIF